MLVKKHDILNESCNDATEEEVKMYMYFHSAILLLCLTIDYMHCTCINASLSFVEHPRTDKNNNVALFVQHSSQEAMYGTGNAN